VAVFRALDSVIGAGMSTLAVGVSLLNASGIPKKIVDSSIVSGVFDSLVSKYNLSGFSSFKDNYLKLCSGHLFIKTIAAPDSSVHVDEIYVPLELSGHSRIEVSDGTTLDNSSRASLIVGFAGQGKSTILRKLLSNNISRISRLPFFYELKNYNGGGIESEISRNLNLQGVKFSAAGLSSIFKDSNVRLFLDAFDECPSEHKKELFSEIDKLIRKYNCNIICTTRPDTELDALVGVDVYRVEFLRNSQIKSIIHNTCQGTQKSADLYAALERSKFHREHDSILRSPILVVLFCISYNLGIDIPESLSQFYKNIFDTVFVKHDNVKGGVVRVRHWNDDRSIYRDIFDYFCFISQRSSVSSFSFNEFSRFISSTLKYFSKDADLADKISNELIQITNLIIKDGYDEYKFIHKSIQEFFCASFLCVKLSTDEKSAFYMKCAAENDFYNVFSNTLMFLQEIDGFDYRRFYIVPGVGHILGLNGREITDNYCVDAGLMGFYMDNLIFTIKYREGFDSKAGATLEAELYQPKVGGSIKNTFMNKMFTTAADFIGFKSPNNKALRAVTRQALDIGDGMYQLSLRDAMVVLKITQAEIENSLVLSMGILFRKEYNSAVQEISNRTLQVTSQGYMDFSLES
jgi:hypothetical protein